MAIKLNKDEQHGIVCGRVMVGKTAVKYEQHGLQFDADGKCLTKDPKTVAAAKKMIKDAGLPAPEPESDPELDIQPVRFAHSGAGRYDVIGTDGSVLADNVSLEEAEEMVPTQVGGENLAFKSEEDLTAHLKLVGGKPTKKDTVDTLIKKIKKAVAG